MGRPDYDAFIECLCRLQVFENGRAKLNGCQTINISDGKLVSATLNGKGGFFFSESVGLFHATVKAVQGSYRVDYYTSQVSAVLERSGIVSMKDDFDIDFGLIVKWKAKSMWFTGSVVPEFQHFQSKVQRRKFVGVIPSFFRGLKVPVTEFEDKVNAYIGQHLSAAEIPQSSSPNPPEDIEHRIETRMNEITKQLGMEPQIYSPRQDIQHQIDTRIIEIRMRNAEREMEYALKTSIDRARILNDKNELYIGKAVERYNLFPPRHYNRQDSTHHRPQEPVTEDDILEPDFEPIVTGVGVLDLN